MILGTLLPQIGLSVGPEESHSGIGPGQGLHLSVTTQCSGRDHRGHRTGVCVLSTSRHLRVLHGGKYRPCPSKAGRKRNDRCQETGTTCGVKVALMTPFWVGTWAPRNGCHCYSTAKILSNGCWPWRLGQERRGDLPLSQSHPPGRAPEHVPYSPRRKGSAQR